MQCKSHTHQGALHKPYTHTSSIYVVVVPILNINLLLWYKYNSTNCTQMLADIIQNPSYITATCVLYTKHYITNCCTGYLITGTSGPGDGSNEGIPLCIHFEMLYECFSNPILGALVCNDYILILMLALDLSDS